MSFPFKVFQLHGSFSNGRPITFNFIQIVYKMAYHVELGIWVEPDGLARIGPIFWRVGP